MDTDGDGTGNNADDDDDGDYVSDSHDVPIDPEFHVIRTGMVWVMP